MSNKIVISIPKNSEFIGILRLTSVSVANAYKFDLDSIEDIKMCVAEGAVSFIKSDSTEDLEVAFEYKENGLFITLPCVEELQTSDNLSIQIIEALMDEVVIESGQLTMIKKSKDEADE